MNKILKYAAISLAIGFIAMVAYGIKTDCPDTAIYYYCGD